jgi:hypothetical protein
VQARRRLREAIAALDDKRLKPVAGAG